MTIVPIEKKIQWGVVFFEYFLFGCPCIRVYEKRQFNTKVIFYKLRRILEKTGIRAHCHNEKH